MGPKKGPDGTLAITFPMADKKLPLIAVEDIGKSALAIFKKGKEFIGKTIGIAGEHLTGAQMAAALTKALGQEVRYNEVSPDGLSEVRVSGRGGSGQHVPVQARFPGGILRAA